MRQQKECFIDETSFFLKLPGERFRVVYSWNFLIRKKLSGKHKFWVLIPKKKFHRWNFFIRTLSNKNLNRKIRILQKCNIVFRAIWNRISNVFQFHYRILFSHRNIFLRPCLFHPLKLDRMLFLPEFNPLSMSLLEPDVTMMKQAKKGFKRRDLDLHQVCF